MLTRRLQWRMSTLHCDTPDMTDIFHHPCKALDRKLTREEIVELESVPSWPACCLDIYISTHIYTYLDIYPGHCSDKWATKTVAAVLLGHAAALQIKVDACACTFSPEDAVKMWLLTDSRSTKLTDCYLHTCRQVRLSKAVVTKIVTNWFPVFCLGAELWSLGSSINKTTSIRDVRGKFHTESNWDVFVAGLSLA